jgi:hypothetical protein
MAEKFHALLKTLWKVFSERIARFYFSTLALTSRPAAKGAPLDIREREVQAGEQRSTR